MRKEIGSEFWDIPLSDKTKNGVFQHASWYLSGRSALFAIIEDIKRTRHISRALLPSWCCDSMILPFLKNEINVDFYPVYVKDGSLVQDIPDVNADEILFIIDYFGYVGNFRFENCGGTVIRDITHSTFSRTYSDADYYFGSLRKWCGFKTGGFALGLADKGLHTDEHYVSLRNEAMREKAEYIRGDSESKKYLELFCEAEEYLDNCSLAGADPREIEIAANLDVEFMRERRRENASVLLSALSDIAIFKELGKDDCPLFVPIAVREEERDNLRRYLIAKEIYCPVHWPISEWHKLDEKTRRIFKSEISLVCDQRYSKQDMYRIVEAINEYYSQK